MADSIMEELENVKRRELLLTTSNRISYNLIDFLKSSCFNSVDVAPNGSNFIALYPFLTTPFAFSLQSSSCFIPLYQPLAYTLTLKTIKIYCRGL